MYPISWDSPIHQTDGMWYSLLYCEDCGRFTTHKAKTMKWSEMESGKSYTISASALSWRCVEHLE